MKIEKDKEALNSDKRKSYRTPVLSNKEGNLFANGGISLDTVNITAKGLFNPDGEFTGNGQHSEVSFNLSDDWQRITGTTMQRLKPDCLDIISTLLSKSNEYCCIRFQRNRIKKNRQPEEKKISFWTRQVKCSF